MEDQFVYGTLTDLLSRDREEVLCVYVSNNNVERSLLWYRMGEISSGWIGLSVVMGDFNAIRLHSEAFGGSSVSGDIEEFYLAIDLVEPTLHGNWFTWTSKVHGLGLMRRLDRILISDEGLVA